MQKSNSSLDSLSVLEKLRYNSELLSIELKRRQNVDCNWLAEVFVEYDRYCRKFVGKPLNECRAVEIGFGAKPFRFFFLLTMGVDIYGVDLDAPLIKMSLSRLNGIRKNNGLERAAKSLVRWLVVLRKEYEELARFCAKHSDQNIRSFDDLVVRAQGRLIVSDAGSNEFWSRFNEPLQFIYSEDVFEHLPPDTLDSVLQRIWEHLAPTGVAMIRPCIFSGITGGHQLEWYAHRLVDKAMTRRSEPWDHLRQNRFPANTYLNRLLRRDYRVKFSQYFNIVEEIVLAPDLGREYFAPSIAEELGHYPDEELFSNQVLFVLRRK
jgi:hypothetical protein